MTFVTMEEWIKAIDEDPENWDLRRVFADWLEDAELALANVLELIGVEA